jgi:WD40 repeat protein
MKKKVLGIGIMVWLFLSPVVFGKDFSQKPVARLGKGVIEQVAFSPDGKLLAVGGSLGVWLYSIPDLKEVEFFESLEWVESVTFTPDGRALLVTTEHTASLWRKKGIKWEYFICIGIGSYLPPPAFSPDGHWLATANRDPEGIIIWDMTVDEKLIWEIPQEKLIKNLGLFFFPKKVKVLEGTDPTWLLAGVAFHPDGEQIVAIENDTFHFWKVGSWEKNTTISKAILQGRSVRSPSFSPNGKWLTVQDGTAILLWETSQLQTTPPITLGSFASAFSPDGKFLAYGGKGWDPSNSTYDHSIYLWDLSLKKKVAVLKGHKEWVESLSFSPDGKLLASGGADGVIRLWDILSQKEVAVAKGYNISYFAASPNEELIALGYGDGSIHFWDITRQQELQTILEAHESGISSLAFASDGKLLASGADDANEICLWDMIRKKKFAILEESLSQSIIFSPNGKLLATRGFAGRVPLWDITLQKQIAELQILENQKFVYSIAFSPDGNLLAASCEDGTIRFWDVFRQEEKAVQTFSTEAIAFSPHDGNLLAFGTREALYLWDVKMQKEAVKISRGGNPIRSIAFAPNGKCIALAVDSEIQIWDIKKQKQIASLEGHKRKFYGVSSIAFTASGEWLVSNGEDGTILLWDMTSLIPKSAKDNQKPQPKGKYLITLGYLKTAVFQNFPNPFNPETWIPFELSQKAEVTISIYDIKGKLVRTLNLGHKEAGFYTTKEKAAYWDGRNETGEPASSGVYFYTIQVGPFQATKKMVITK